MKETIMGIARQHGRVTVDDLMVALDDASPDDVERQRSYPRNALSSSGRRTQTRVRWCLR
jgi:hypothetical protein